MFCGKRMNIGGIRPFLYKLAIFDYCKHWKNKTLGPYPFNV